MSGSIPAITPWLVVGFAGQTFFFSRFLIQWIHSERAGRSTIPHVFWYLSLGGGLLLLAYAVQLGDPVFILGQSLGTLVYVRNLMLLRRPRAAAGPADGL